MTGPLQWSWVVVVLFALGCGGRAATSPSPSAPAEYPSNPPWYSVDLPGGGQARLRFIEFLPARGTRLVPGAGAFVRVEYTTTGDHLMLILEAVGWDGQQVLPTSFWSGSGNVDFVCIATSSSRTRNLGQETSQFTTYPTASDPAVPFVRVRYWVVPFADACAPPNVGSLNTGPPTMEIIEPLNWAKP